MQPIQIVTFIIQIIATIILGIIFYQMRNGGKHGKN